MKADYTIRQMRIGYTDHNNQHGSIMCHVSDFHNALMQVKKIAFDGVRWFIQPKSNSQFIQISESEIPQEVKQRFSK
jgi:hypothetical protein